MKLNIIVNKYILIWYLLFSPSVNDEIHKLKQDLYKKKKDQYIKLNKEREVILENLDNYIPDDDYLFDAVSKTDSYKKLKQETNRTRLSLLEIWDKNKKMYLRELNKIIKYEFAPEYTLCVVHPSLNVVEVDCRRKVITMGKRLSMNDSTDFFTYLFYKILKNDFLNIKNEEKDIVYTIIELIATNELYTRLTGKSKYDLGKKELRGIKKSIYPFWLMFLGVPKEKLDKYMTRDNIYFDINKINYNEQLKNVDIFTFISYIIRNKKQILKLRNEIDELEKL